MKTKNASRNFGFTFAGFFLFLAAAPLLKNHPLRIWPLLPSIGFLFLAFFRPSSLTFLSKKWQKFGEALQSFVGPVFLLLLFFFVFFPIGALLKLFKGDLINAKYDKTRETYWIKSEKVMTNFRDQF